MGEKKQFAVGAALSYGAIVFGVLAGLLYTPWVICTVGDGNYGIYTLALSVVNFFLLDLGIGSAVTRFLSGYDARGQREEAARFLGVVYRVLGLIALAAALCMALFSLLAGGIYPKLEDSGLTLFRRLLAILGLYSVITFPFTPFGGILAADQRFAALKACDLGQKIFTVALAAGALAAGRGVYALALCHVLGSGVVLLIKYRLIRRGSRRRARLRGWDRAAAAELWGYSRWTAVMTLAHRCIFNIMPTVIAALVGSAEVTLFALAATLESYFFTVGEAVNGMFLPKMSRLLAREGGEREVAALTVRIGRFQITVVGLIFLGFACLGRDFVALWMGPDYEQVWGCALLLMAPGLISIPQQGARTALLAEGQIRGQAMVYAGMAAVNLLLALALIPALGVLGAALSVCIAYLARTVGMNLLYRRLLSLDLRNYVWRVYGRWLPAAAITLVVGLAAIPQLPLSGWGGLVGRAALLCVVYGGLLLCFDRSRIREILKHRG